MTLPRIPRVGDAVYDFHRYFSRKKPQGVITEVDHEMQQIVVRYTGGDWECFYFDDIDGCWMPDKEVWRLREYGEENKWNQADSGITFED